jgi:hypothetical protein
VPGPARRGGIIAPAAAGLAACPSPSEVQSMLAGPNVARRALAVALAVLLSAGCLRAQDDGDEDDPLLPGGLGAGGIGLPTDLGPTAPKRRQWTATQLLRWEWEPGLPPAHGAPKALSEAEALVVLADRDPRPLLVLRECAGCKRDDHGLVEREIENERTILLGRWFHPVRVSDDVLAPNHPFHALFAATIPPHMVAATLDGSLVSAVPTRANAAQLGKTLSGVLRKAYRKDPDVAVKALLVLLDDFDRVDAQLKGLDDKLAATRKEKGADSREVRELEADRKLVDAERQALLEKGKALDDLGLQLPPEPPSDD